MIIEVEVVDDYVDRFLPVDPVHKKNKSVAGGLPIYRQMHVAIMSASASCLFLRSWLMAH